MVPCADFVMSVCPTNHNHGSLILGLFFQARLLISLAKLGKSLTAIAGRQPGLRSFRE